MIRRRPTGAPTSRSEYYFFLGTVAELIKVVPVMHELASRGIGFKLIASGQNRLTDDAIFEACGLKPADITLNERPIRRSAVGLFGWFCQTLIIALWRLRREFRGRNRAVTLIVHGDTVTTVMGAFVGRCLGARVAHVEAGLRSFDFLQPFPEEIDRYLTSFLADISFAPSPKAVSNLRGRRGRAVDTGFNTNIDSLAFALGRGVVPDLARRFSGRDFYIFIMHRQENLLNKAFVREMVETIAANVDAVPCVFVMHSMTRSVLTELGLLDAIERHPNITTVDRLPYLDFVTLLARSRFILTDGGGNQQEAYYLGKPCLILRNVTEGEEGLGSNVVLARGDAAIVREFIAGYERYERPPITPDTRPSRIVADVLLEPT